MKHENNALETQVFSTGLLSTGGNEKSTDLGFGSEVAKRTRRRLLNRDGSFNVEREGYSLIASRSLYHFLVNLSWPRFLLLVIAAYLGANLVFALTYFACGADTFRGMDEATAGGRFLQSFFFSVQTLATIGYGAVSPHGVIPNLLVTVEAFVGLMGVALATGLFFTRFARPTARILYSKFALIAPYQGKTSFQFRVANERANQIFHVDARVTLSKLEFDGSSLKRRFYQLALEREQVMFLPLSWTIVHPIDEESPLWGLTAKDLAASDAEFLIMLEGTDDTFSQNVHFWTSYKHDEVIWGARFAGILEEREDGRVKIDLRRIHDFNLVES